MSSAGGLNKSGEVRINVTRLLRNLMNSLSCQPFAKADYSELGHCHAFDISDAKSALESELGRKVRRGALKAD